jgi:N-acetylmuramoyl-L-alanine amidase
MRAIQGGHLRRGMMDVGYHFVVMPSGTVFVGRPLSARGAHARAHNSGAVGIALAGNFDEEEPTTDAVRSLERLLRRLTGARRGTVSVVGHGELTGSTACPGGSLRRYLEERRAGADQSGYRPSVR